MIALVCALAVVHAYQFWLREIFFYREPKPGADYHRDPPCTIYSPVEGRVVYVKRFVATDAQYIEKEGRILPAPSELVPGREYYQIGIFMTPFNNHHLIEPATFLPARQVYELQGAYSRMWTYADDWKMLTGAWWRDWLDRKLAKYIKVNARKRYLLSNGAVMDLIFDRYVSRYTVLWNKKFEGRTILGFVGRGSQVDLFLPVRYSRGTDFYPVVEIGHRVTQRSWLGFYGVKS